MKDNAIKNHALVTGATSGFGYEFCRLLARDGYNLVMVARSQEQLLAVSNELLGEFPIKITTLAIDLFKPEAAEEVFNAVREQNIIVDILVNNAGQGQYGKLVDYEFERDIDMVNLNVVSLVGLTKLFLKEMLARKTGRILQLSSLLGKVPTPYMAVYAGTKAFVSSFTEGLIQEVEGTGVTVTALLPGAADTDFFHKAGAQDTQTYREQELQDPAKVAMDGYDALMSGESKVISGLKNKIQGAMSTVMPDGALTSMMEKQMSPSEKPEGRERITHKPSRDERNRIQQETGKTTGDYQNHEGHAHDDTDHESMRGETL
jgi:short-subunit dehydrogenase